MSSCHTTQADQREKKVQVSHHCEELGRPAVSILLDVSEKRSASSSKIPATHDGIKVDYILVAVI